MQNTTANQKPQTQIRNHDLKSKNTNANHKTRTQIRKQEGKLKNTYANKKTQTQIKKHECRSETKNTNQKPQMQNRTTNANQKTQTQIRKHKRKSETQMLMLLWLLCHVDPGSNPARGPLLHVTSPSLPFPVYPLSNKGVYALKKSFKKWGVWWQVECNKSIMVDEPVPDQSSPMETNITPEDNKLGLL